MINENNRENMNCFTSDNKRPCLDNLNNRIYDLYIRKLGKKRTFKEMDAYNQDNIEKGLSSLTINKRLKLRRNNQYLPVEYQIPVSQFCDTNKDGQKLNVEEEISSEDNFDIGKEKKLVESYYAEKNHLLAQLMFGNYNC